jgi:hypothetical protein
MTKKWEEWLAEMIIDVLDKNSSMRRDRIPALELAIKMEKEAQNERG